MGHGILSIQDFMLTFHYTLVLVHYTLYFSYVRSLKIGLSDTFEMDRFKCYCTTLNVECESFPLIKLLRFF